MKERNGGRKLGRQREGDTHISARCEREKKEQSVRECRLRYTVFIYLMNAMHAGQLQVEVHVVCCPHGDLRVQHRETPVLGHLKVQ